MAMIGPELVDCPHCGAQGGGKDYFGEWADCFCCGGEGRVSKDRLLQYDTEVVLMDEEIDRQMALEQ